MNLYQSTEIFNLIFFNCRLRDYRIRRFLVPNMFGKILVVCNFIEQIFFIKKILN